MKKFKIVIQYEGTRGVSFNVTAATKADAMEIVRARLINGLYQNGTVEVKGLAE
jgi:hypothetical protein